MQPSRAESELNCIHITSPQKLAEWRKRRPELIPEAGAEPRSALARAKSHKELVVAVSLTGCSSDIFIMLYELIAVVRTGNVAYVKDVARSAGNLVLSRTGTIRALQNWGIFDLPSPTVKHQTQHHRGHYFCMTFDSSIGVQQEIQRQLKLNPHMIRYSVVKIGDKLGGYRNQRGKIEDVTGELEWNDEAKMMQDVGSGTRSVEDQMVTQAQTGPLRRPGKSFY